MPKKDIIEPIDGAFESVVSKIVQTTNKPHSQKGVTHMVISEADLYIPTLRIANAKPGGFVSTSNLILELEALFNPKGEDAEILDNRSDTRFSQKVRNIISHRGSPRNLIGKGYAEYDEERKGIQITIAGRKLLEQVTD